MSKSYNISSYVALLALSISAIGCAAGGGGNGGGTAFVRMDMGISTAQDFQEQTNDLLRRMSFRVFRQDQVPVPLIESEWRNQTPTADEQALGVTEFQCRIIVRGRERNPMGGQRVFQFSYTMETQVKTVDSPDWTEMGVTPERRVYANEIGRELRTMLEMARR